VTIARRPGPLGSDEGFEYFQGPGYTVGLGTPTLRGSATHAGPVGAHADVPNPANQSLNFEDLYNDVERWEGVVKFMYLDNAEPPKVTVGAGNMLPDVKSAQALPFVNTATNRPATAAEIESAFKKVKAMKGAMRAPKYKQTPSIEITKAYAKGLVVQRLKGEFLPKLRGYLRGFDKYPLPARRALIDMIYNMGLGRVKDEKHKARGLMSFGSLKTACDNRDWAAEALHSQRPNKKNNPHTAARNAWTKALFESADSLAHRYAPGGADHAHP
jgi:GH24 family phage-related lysozyme (muramidase)